jgi:hypothetical protein
MNAENLKWSLKKENVATDQKKIIKLNIAATCKFVSWKEEN